MWQALLPTCPQGSARILSYNFFVCSPEKCPQKLHLLGMGGLFAATQPTATAARRLPARTPGRRCTSSGLHLTVKDAKLHVQAVLWNAVK